MDRREQRERRMRVQRRRAAAVGIAVVLVVIAVVAVSMSSSGSSHPTAASTTTTTSASQQSDGGAKAAVVTRGPVALEAGVEPWQLPAAVSRPSVVANGTGFTVLGGLAPSQASVAAVYSVNPSGGLVVPAGTLSAAVHDAAGATVGRSTFVLGGGSPNTVATVQSIATPSVPVAAPASPVATTGTVSEATVE